MTKEVIAHVNKKRRQKNLHNSLLSKPKLKKSKKRLESNKTKIKMQKLTKGAMEDKEAKENAPLNIKSVKSDSVRRTIIMAHRGGNFGPDNSLKNIRGAI